MHMDPNQPKPCFCPCAMYSVASDWANRPVNYVSFGDAMRFTNWLHIGQPTGAQGLSTTEDGAYYLNGAMTDAQLSAVTRKTGWQWAVTSENEWYKAVYYDPNKAGGAGYWLYPTRTNATPSNALSSTGTNNANFFGWNGSTFVYTIGSPYYRTEAGAFASSASPYGTFDQGGNAWEWNEGFISGSYRGLRGGTFYFYAYRLPADYRSDYAAATLENLGTGFRVVQVPEPATLALLALGGLVALRRRR